MDPVADLRLLLSSGTSLITIDTSEEPRAPKFEPPRKLGLKPEFTARARAARAALRAEAPDASAAEQIVHDLVEGEMAVVLALMDAQVELVTRLSGRLKCYDTRVSTPPKGDLCRSGVP